MFSASLIFFPFLPTKPAEVDLCYANDIIKGTYSVYPDINSINTVIIRGINMPVISVFIKLSICTTDVFPVWEGITTSPTRATITSISKKQICALSASSYQCIPNILDCRKQTAREAEKQTLLAEQRNVKVAIFAPFTKRLRLIETTRIVT